MRNILPILIFTFISVFSLHAQEAQIIEQSTNSEITTINTDRPTQAFAPFIVPLHTFQIETGFIMEKESNKQDDITRYDLATTQFRYGVFDNFEIRASGFYRIKEVSPKAPEVVDSTISGFGPLRLGFKVHVVEEKGLRPEMAIITNITLRHFGEDTYTPTFSYPTASFLAQNTLSKRFTLVYNAGFAYSGKNADGFFIYRIALNYSITNKFLIFIEPYGNFDHGDLPNHKIDGGIVFVVRNNLQLDASIGTGFISDISKTFGALGLSWRIPH